MIYVYVLNNLSCNCLYSKAAGFLLTPYLEYFTPNLEMGTPVFSNNFFKFTMRDS